MVIINTVDIVGMVFQEVLDSPRSYVEKPLDQPIRCIFSDLARFTFASVVQT